MAIFNSFLYVYQRVNCNLSGTIKHVDLSNQEEHALQTALESGRSLKTLCVPYRNAIWQQIMW